MENSLSTTLFNNSKIFKLRIGKYNYFNLNSKFKISNKYKCKSFKNLNENRKEFNTKMNKNYRLIIKNIDYKQRMYYNYC